MEYRIVLLANGEYKKTLIKYKTIESTYNKFYELIEENSKVLFPKRFVNTNGITPIKYEICITKITEDTDTFRLLRDDYGKVYIEPKLGDWTILISNPYEIEEKFWIYGFDSKVKRPNITEIVKRLMIGAHAKRMVKQVIVVHNKLVTYNEDQFDMVVCKNILDAQRLHHTLAKICKKQKIKSLLFMGTATPATIGRMYDIIQEETKWKIQKIRRTTTRP